jgi:histone H3/H4
MVKVSDVYKGGGSFLSAKLADELELYQTDLKIEDVELKEIKEDKKLIISFEDIEEILPLNVTNARILQEAMGDETDDWIGNIIQLLPVKRNFQGKMVDAIQVMVVGQKKLRKTKASADEDLSKVNKNRVKEAMKQSNAIRNAVDELRDTNQDITPETIRKTVKAAKDDNMITKDQYIEALEALPE